MKLLPILLALALLLIWLGRSKGSAPWGYNKQLPALFAALGMKDAVITCSEKNPADEETLDALDALGCRVWQAVNGTVRVISDQNGITISQK